MLARRPSDKHPLPRPCRIRRPVRMAAGSVPPAKRSLPRPRPPRRAGVLAVRPSPSMRSLGDVQGHAFCPRLTSTLNSHGTISDQCRRLASRFASFHLSRRRPSRRAIRGRCGASERGKNGWKRIESLSICRLQTLCCANFIRAWPGCSVRAFQAANE